MTQEEEREMNKEICCHETVTREIVLGMASGDKKCVKCGDLFASPAELKEARVVALEAKKSQTPKEVSSPG